jgi:hypothetical protein
VINKIYIITVHKGPKQLERLINQLNDVHSFFYIHIDLKSDYNKFKFLNKIDNVELVNNRVDCIWGDFSQCIATLNLIEIVLKNHKDGFCMFLSGSDYPIRSIREMDRFITRNYDTVFMSVKNAYEVWPFFDERISKYKVNKSSKKLDYVLLRGLNKKTIKALLKGHINIFQFLKISFIKRKLKIHSGFYGGSNWWQMNLKNLDLVYSYIIDNKVDLFNFYKDSISCDEFLFQTAIMDLKKKGAHFKIKNTLTYAEWRKKGSSPHTFNKSDFNLLKNKSSNYFFARKFDTELDDEILDLIDHYKSHNLKYTNES